MSMSNFTLMIDNIIMQAKKNNKGSSYGLDLDLLTIL